jgi:pyruvate formate lyase activating enzyme
VSACPNAALTLSPEGIVTDTTLCELCGTCAAVCPTKAIEMSGIAMAVEEIMNEIEKERVFIEQSGGGVTFSGGEPMLHADFLVRLLDACRERGIHTAVDTAGLVNPETLLEVAKRTDLFLYDLKLMDSDHHREWTGVPNERILANLRVLAESGANINVRIPLVGGVNDDEENIVETARFLAGLPGERIKVNLLPYHKIAQAKYAKLGKLEAFRVLKEPDAEEITRVIKIFLDFGVEASR